MVKPELIDYIRQSFEKGLDKNRIKNELFRAGWKLAEIEEGFAAVSSAKAELAPPPPVSSSTVVISPAITTVGGSENNPPPLPGPVALIKETLAVFRARFKTFVAIILSIFFANIVLGAVIGSIVSFAITPLVEKAENAPNASLLILPFLAIPFVLIIALIGAAIQAWGQMALIYAALGSPEKIDFKEAFRRARPKIFAYWWLSFLMGIIVGGGVLLFIVPGLYFMVWFIFAYFVLAEENLTGMDALLKSREYVKGNILKIIGCGLIFCLFYLGCLLLLALPLALIGTIFRAATTAETAQSINNSITVSVISPLSTIYLYLIYKHLKALKGNFTFQPSARAKKILILTGIFGIVTFVFGILAAVILISINPAEQLKKARELQPPTQLQESRLPSPFRS